MGLDFSLSGIGNLGGHEYMFEYIIGIIFLCATIFAWQWYKKYGGYRA